MDKPGTLYLKGLTVPDTARGRIRYMSDGDIREMVAYWGDKQPVPEPQLQAIGGDSYINRQRAAPGDTGTRQVRDVPAADIPTGSAAPRRFASAEESRQHVRDVLASFPAGGTVGEIAERAERGLTMVQARLNELAAAGLAVAKGRKRPVWRAVPSSQ
jgi:hypothetical protein